MNQPPEAGSKVSGYCNVVAVGFDLASVPTVREAIESFGDAYLNRVFTAAELTDCAAFADRVPSLAARFAAKEAVMKALVIEADRPLWTLIEVVRKPEGSCRLRLTGAAARLARQRGIGEMLVSLTHDGDFAAAVVIATSACPQAQCSEHSPSHKEQLGVDAQQAVVVEHERGSIRVTQKTSHAQW